MAHHAAQICRLPLLTPGCRARPRSCWGPLAAILACTLVALATAPTAAATVYVAPTGSDQGSGTAEQPFQTLSRAQAAIRSSKLRGQEPLTVVLQQGTYALPDTLVFTAADSGTAAAPVTWTAAPGAEVVISGGSQLTLTWKPFRDGIFQAHLPDDLAIDQLFLNGQRQWMARYPNFDPTVAVYNGFSADAFAPDRAARWANPVGGFIHAMHRQRWGGYHYRITGKTADNQVVYEGGWQNNRQMGMHAEHRFVENIFEELDAAGEWYHDSTTSTLFVIPPPGVALSAATVEVARLRHLLEFQGRGPESPRHIHLQGLTFRHAARTFMETKEPLLRSDWTIYRGGAVVFTAAEDCSITDCEFDQVGGNAIFVNKANRRIVIRGTHIHGAGGSGICFVGSPTAVRNPLFEYGEKQAYADIDLTPGPQTDDYPRDCTVDDCLIHEIGIVEKQAAGIQISMARGITVRHCSIYDIGRAGINVSEGTFGGHLIEFCDVFDTVLETHDHGSFNSWGRDRYWNLTNVPPGKLPELARLDCEKTILRNSRWRCDHGWDVDLDDGSSNYEITNNVFLKGGLKLREGFFRTVRNNIAVQSTLHPHVWYEDSGDIVTNNIWMGRYRPARMKHWGQQIDNNLFLTKADRDAFRSQGCDNHSVVGDPQFVNPASGDYRVGPDSPALAIGFVNFPMDQFGVQTPKLKAIARTPVLPNSTPNPPERRARRARTVSWLGATLADITGEGYSAFGIAEDDGGVHLAAVPTTSAAFRAGLRPDDVIQRVDGRAVKNLAAFRAADGKAEPGKPRTLAIVRGQQPQEVVIPPRRIKD